MKGMGVALQAEETAPARCAHMLPEGKSLSHLDSEQAGGHL